jgi:hypothetical protein
MSGPKRIVHKKVPKIGQSSGKLRIVLLLSLVKTGVFEEEKLAIGQLLRSLSGHGANQLGAESDLEIQKGREVIRNGPK